RRRAGGRERARRRLHAEQQRERDGRERESPDQRGAEQRGPAGDAQDVGVRLALHDAAPDALDVPDAEDAPDAPDVPDAADAPDAPEPLNAVAPATSSNSASVAATMWGPGVPAGCAASASRMPACRTSPSTS